jgi:TldD protein
MKDLVQSIVDKARRMGVDFCDARAVERSVRSITLQDTRADRLYEARNAGIGIRVLVDGSWGFAATGVLERRAAETVLEQAVSLARAARPLVTDPGMVAGVDPAIDTEIEKPEIDPTGIEPSAIIEKLHAFENSGRSKHGGAIVNSIVGYGDSASHQVLANTAGTLIEKRGVRTSVSTMFVAMRDGVMQRAREVRARHGGFETVEGLEPEGFSIKAADTAVHLLTAKPCPVGCFTVVFHPSITGLLMHEALGHNAEADGVWTGNSILEGRIGEKVAADTVTIVDDPTRPGYYGSYTWDDEGVPARRRTIVENGLLKGYIHDLETAARFGTVSSGAGRAEGFGHVPIVRMSNTFMEPGETPAADIFKGIDRGVYLKDGHWGYVFVEKGQFTCHAGRGQEIVDGELGEELRDVSVSGMTLETLQNMEAVADDFEMDMPGMCGKNGQGAPTDAGGPHVRVKDIVVGGRG